MHDFIQFRLNLQKRLLDVVDRFVVLNRWAFEVMVSSGAPTHKLVLNYLGHSATGIETKPGPGAEPTSLPIRVGYVGRFAKGKGLDTMLSAIALLPPSLDLTFEFRGAVNNEQGKVIATRIESLRSRFPGISVEPAVPPESIFEIIRGFDVLCVPSVDYENGPTVVSEAHAVGTPVIGTAIGAMPELIQDGINGLLLPPGDARALTAALEKIARDPAATIDRWRSKLPAARTMKEIAADYESLYQGMLSESNQTSSAP
jgi:glycosyltransferase involved in cell wall biosynthesis